MHQKRQGNNRDPRKQALHKKTPNKFKENIYKIYENSYIRKIKDLLKDSLLVLSFPGNNFTPLDFSSPELFTGREQ